MALLTVITQGPKGKKNFFEVRHCDRAQSYPITNLSTTHRPDLITQPHPNTKEQRSINQGEEQEAVVQQFEWLLL